MIIEESYELLFAKWRPSKAISLIQSKSDGLNIRNQEYLSQYEGRGSRE